jgi:hypothetical protein
MKGKEKIYGWEDRSKCVSLFGIPDLDKIPRTCSLKKEGVQRMIIVGGLIRLLHWEMFERLIDDLDFKCAHFLEVCQKYADRGGRLPDDYKIAIQVAGEIELLYRVTYHG